MSELRSDSDALVWRPYVVAAGIGGLLPVVGLLIPRAPAALVVIGAAIGVGLFYTSAPSLRLALSFHALPSLVLLVINVPKGFVPAMVAVATLLLGPLVTWGIIALSQRIRHQ